MFRTPKIVKMSEEEGTSEGMIEILKNVAIKKNYPIETAQKYLEDIQTQKGLVYSEIFSHVFKEKLDLIVKNFDVVLYNCSGLFPKFILHDNYANFQWAGEKQGLHPDVRIWESQIQFFCPLSEDFCLGFVPKTERRGEKIFDFFIQQVNYDFMLALNEKSLHQAENYMYASSEFEMKRLLSIKN